VLPEVSPEDKARGERYLALGERHLEQGNIGAARSFFQRAAEAGLAEGALRMAATFDPAELARLDAVALNPDREQARKWYERARELGAREAEERLARLRGR
jgi:TPR repeat protein